MLLVVLLIAGKLQRMEEDNATCLEDRLRELGIVGKKDGISREGYLWNGGKTSIDATMFDGAHLLVGGDIPAKKVRFS